MKSHLIVNALAGTGKTTTICWSLTEVPSNVQLSKEQRDIINHIKEVKKSRCNGVVALQAFNKSIAEELAQRLPGIECRTCNAFGHRAWAKYVNRRIFVDSNKSKKIFRDLFEDLPWKDRQCDESIVSSMCGFLKATYSPELHSDFLSEYNIEKVADKFSVQLETRHFEMVQRVMKRSIDERSLIDFDDQIFLPVYYDISVPQYDILGVDEAQDLNRPKQELAYKMSKNGTLIVVGDYHQAIYGFSGADSESMPRMSEQLQSSPLGCVVKPLTETRRCSVAAVELANRFVPELRAHESNKEGFVARIGKKDLIYHLTSGHEKSRMVICTTNAPLTKLAFKLIASNVRCFIQGRDIGSSLKRAILDTKKDNILDAYCKASETIDRMIEKEQRSKFPSDEKIGLLTDRKDCLGVLVDKCSSIEEFEQKVDNLFKDSGKPGDVRLSSGHKSKGLESDDIFLLNPESIGFPFNRKTTSQMNIQQAKNLAYVIYTRSKDGIYLVENGGNEDEAD